MLKRRRGQNASINPALEEIEVDENTLRASLTCELCEKVLRDANTVVRSLLLLLNVVDDDEEEEAFSFSLLLSFSLSLSSSSFSLRAQNASTMIYVRNIYSLSRDIINDNRRNVCTRFVSSASVRRLSSGNQIIVRRVFRLQEEEEEEKELV